MVNRHRGSGWEYLHVAVDDRSRLAYSELLPDERKASAVAFLARTRAWFARHGVRVERLMTDNGNACRSHAVRDAWPLPASATCAPSLPHRAPTARPSASSRPRGRECAYARAFRSSERASRCAAPLAAPRQRAPAAPRPRRTAPNLQAHHEPPAWQQQLARLLRDPTRKPGKAPLSVRKCRKWCSRKWCQAPFRPRPLRAGAGASDGRARLGALQSLCGREPAVLGGLDRGLERPRA